MVHLIDRRFNNKNKSAVNRQRFLKRYKKQIRRAVDEKVRERSITDTSKGEKISIPVSDTHEPTFHHGAGGRASRVFPGNKEFVVGDKIRKPSGVDRELAVRPLLTAKAWTNLSLISANRSFSTSSSKTWNYPT